MPAGKACDRRAELAALLRGAGTLHLPGERDASGGRSAGVQIEVEHPTVARRALGLVQSLAGTTAVLVHEPGKGHPRARLIVRASGVPIRRLTEAGALDGRGLPPRGVPRRLVARRCCAAAYLRGTFLARGAVSAPRAPAHFELRCADRPTASAVAALLRAAGVRARLRHHRGSWTAYAKDVASVGAALALMGAHRATLDWEEGQVWKGVHVEASRLANADAANARRIARAAVAQRAAIAWLEAERGLASLPRALREVAELRLANPQASLDELGRLCSPPVSKGAVADRMRRLERMAGREAG